MFKNESKTRIMAIVAIAMFMLAAFSFVAISNEANADDEPAPQFSITIKDADGATVGTVTGAIGTAFKIKDVTVSQTYDMTNKEIKALYTEAPSESGWDATKKWNQSTKVALGYPEVMFADIKVVSFTIKIWDEKGDIPGALSMGTVTVKNGEAFKISDVKISESYEIGNKAIKALYTEAPTLEDGKYVWDAEAKWDQSTKVTESNSPVKLYAELGEKTFFDNHGFIFIIFAVLAVLLLVAYFYFGYQTPYVLVALILAVILAVLCFIYKDFVGIYDAIVGIFN